MCIYWSELLHVRILDWKSDQKCDGVSYSHIKTNKKPCEFQGHSPLNLCHSVFITQWTQKFLQIYCNFLKFFERRPHCAAKVHNLHNINVPFQRIVHSLGVGPSANQIEIGLCGASEQ